MSISNSDYFTKEGIIERYPFWKQQIECGDFKIYINPRGCLTLEWPNTSICRPSWSQIDSAVDREFSEAEKAGLTVSSSLMSLIVATTAPRSS